MNYLSRIKFLILLALYLLLGQGCTQVFINQPIGTEPYPISSDDLDGTWKVEHADGTEIVYVRVVDSEKGIFQYSTVEVWNLSEEKIHEIPKLVVGKCQLMKSNAFDTKIAYVNCYDANDKKSMVFTKINMIWLGTSYINGEIKGHNTKGIVMWRLDAREFEKAVKANKIKGEIRKGKWSNLKNKEDDWGITIFLLDDPQKIQAVLEEEYCKYYEWEYPFIFKKLD